MAPSVLSMDEYVKVGTGDAKAPDSYCALGLWGMLAQMYRIMCQHPYSPRRRRAAALCHVNSGLNLLHSCETLRGAREYA